MAIAKGITKTARRPTRRFGKVVVLTAIPIAIPIAILIAIPIAIAGCASASDPGGSATFVVSVGSEQFRVRIDNPDLAARARRMISGAEQQKIVNGDLAAGDGGFNTGYSWHMKPGSITFADTTIELCDGRPSDIESNLNYWINTVKRFCPWGGRFTAEVTD